VIEITKEDVLEWKTNPSLRKIREVVREYLREQQLELARKAGRNPQQDLMQSCYFNGIEDAIFNIDLILPEREEKEKND
jgi:hypothetical protein